MKRFLLLLFIFSSLYAFAASPLTDKFKEYIMGINFNGNDVGYVKITITPSGDTAKVITESRMRIKIGPFDVRLDRDTEFTVKDGIGLTDFRCDISSNVPGFTYNTEAVKTEDEVIIITHRGGFKWTRKYKSGRDFDYMTGNLSKQYLGDKKTGIFRFLDLDNNELQFMRVDLIDNYYRMVDGERRLLTEMSVKAKGVGRRVVVLADNDVPLFMELDIPVVGKIYTVVKNVKMDREFAINK